MKILYDHQIFLAQKFGGISRYFSELMQLQDKEVNIDRMDISLFRQSDYQPQTSLLAKGKQFLLKKAGISPSQKLKIPSVIKQSLQQGNFDVFHPTYYHPYFLEWVKKPFVLTVHDMIHEIYREHFDASDPVSSYKKLLSQRASQIITVSETTKQDLQDIFGVPAEKITAIHLASTFAEVKAQKPAQMPSGRYILFAGNREAYKNFYFAVTALAHILKEDQDLELLCTGHPFSKSELAFFKELGIGNKVKHAYLNNDSELAWAYQHAQLFIFPSLYEGFGFPLLEAFASNCPVISSTGGSLPEVGGEAALYFNPKSIQQIQDAAHQALYNAETRAALIAKGKAQYKKYSWHTCRQQTVEVYKKAGMGAFAQPTVAV